MRGGDGIVQRLAAIRRALRCKVHRVQSHNFSPLIDQRPTAVAVRHRRGVLNPIGVQRIAHPLLIRPLAQAIHQIGDFFSGSNARHHPGSNDVLLTNRRAERIHRVALLRQILRDHQRRNLLSIQLEMDQGQIPLRLNFNISVRFMRLLHLSVGCREEDGDLLRPFDHVVVRRGDTDIPFDSHHESAAQGVFCLTWTTDGLTLAKIAFRSASLPKALATKTKLRSAAKVAVCVLTPNRLVCIGMMMEIPCWRRKARSRRPVSLQKAPKREPSSSSLPPQHQS